MTEQELAEKRIEVLQDALQQVRAKKYIATGGLYVDARSRMDGVDNTCKIGQVAKSLDERGTGEACRVCADGALLISSLRKGANDFNTVVGNTNDATKMLLFKQGLFMKDQVDLMERYFESSHLALINDFGGASTPLSRRLSVTNYHDRMIAIFENAIKNNGIFDPNKE